MRGRSRHGFVVACAALAAMVAGPGCTTWSPRTAAPLDVITAERPKTVRITEPDGSTTVVLRPTVRDSLIVGQTRRAHCFENPAGQRRCLTDVVDTEFDPDSVWQLDVARYTNATRGAAMGAAVTLSAAAVFVVGSEGACFWWDPKRCTGIIVSWTGIGALIGAILASSTSR